MKTMTESSGAFAVAEDTGVDGLGNATARRWSFTTAADAARQESEFAAALAAAPKSLRDKFTAAKAPRIEAAAGDAKG